MDNKIFEYIISADQKGERLDHFLASKDEIGFTRSQIKKLIESGFVEVNKETPKPHYKLKQDDRIIVTIPPPKKLEVSPEKIPLDVVFEDEDLIVVNKPRGMVVHPAAGNYSGTLVNALLYHCKDLSGIGGVLRPGIVHRLDKDTSGLIVAAKNDFAHLALAKQFKDKKVTKRYFALVHGVIKENQGKISGPIGRHPRHRKKMAVITGFASHVKGREAITHFRVKERFKNYTLVELTLETGRTHQIRVHLTSLDHAIVGDPLYGHRREEFRVSGQLLHAAELGFIHPRTGQQIESSSEIPEDMDRILRILREK
ncbi:RluA family pseudouridine synthase [Candidatus Margulisiibacteriota bacterium]